LVCEKGDRVLVVWAEGLAVHREEISTSQVGADGHVDFLRYRWVRGGGEGKESRCLIKRVIIAEEGVIRGGHCVWNGGRDGVCVVDHC